MQNTNQPRVRVVQPDGVTYGVAEIERAIPSEPMRTKGKNASRRKYRSTVKRPLPLETRFRLKQSKPYSPFSIRIGGQEYRYSGESRSEVYFQAALGMCAAGYTDAQIIAAVVSTPTWKSREADGKTEDLDRLIERVRGWVSEDEHPLGKEAKVREVTGFFGTFADVTPEEASFLVYPYIVIGGVTMLDGDPKQGKSSFTAALAAHVTTGRDLPFGQLERTGNVLFLSIEDDPAKIILPRLIANGADETKCRYLREYMVLDEKGLDALDEELKRNPVALVIIDPLFTYIDANANSNSATDMARYMTALSEIAAEHDCAILAVRHLNKSDSQDILMRGMGSKAIVGTARSGLLLAKHPSDAKLRAVAHTAANWGPEGDTILFEMEESTDRSPPKLAWKGVDKNMDGSFLLAEPIAGSTGRKPKESIEAEVFLRTCLLDGPFDGKTIGDRAKRLGIKDITLRRAREDLGVTFVKKGRARLWKLPEGD